MVAHGRLCVRRDRQRRRRRGGGPGGVQQGLAALVEALDDPGAWVRQVATRQAISRWRRGRTAHRFLSRSRPPEDAPAPDENTVALVTALRALPEAQRRALVLHHLAGFTVAEIAAQERCPEGTVKARLSRGRAALVPLLDGTPNGEPTHA